MEEAKDMRPLLAWIFVPGLYLCLILSALLSIVAALALAGVVVLIFSLIGRIPVGIIVVIALAGMAGAFASIRASWRALHKPVTFSHAVKLERNAAPAFFESLEMWADELKTAKPANVIVEFGCNFFVTESRVQGFDGKWRGRTLCIGAPMLRCLTPGELKAVIAHELAHFTGEDTAFSKRFYPIYQGTHSALDGMSRVGGISAALTLFLPKVLLKTYVGLFEKIENRIGRTRELRADAVAAQVTDAGTVASALAKVHAYGKLWDRKVVAWITGALQEGKVYRNIPEVFVDVFKDDAAEVEEAASEALRYCVNQEPGTHPSLSDRLSALRERMPATLDVPETSDSAANKYFPELTATEETLTEYETGGLQAVSRLFPKLA